MNFSSQASIIALAFSVLPHFVFNASAQTWTQTGAPSNYWAGVACSADGTALAAITGGQFYVGQIYTSTNAGTNWTLTSAPSLHWTSVASSADGAQLAAVRYVSLVYRSTDYGATWTSNSVLSIADFLSVAMSP